MCTAHGDLAKLVAARMRRSGYPFLWSIKCQVCDNVAVLSGDVPTFYLKQMAQELAAHAQGVREVQNDVHVTGTTIGPRGLRRPVEQSRSSGISEFALTVGTQHVNSPTMTKVNEGS